MRILATADLHYNIWRSRGSARKVARQMCRTGGDVIILAGDTAGVETEWFADCLDLFADFTGLKLLVPGNHCLWVRDDGSSWEKYQRTLPRIARQHGFEYLDLQPALLDGIAFVGSIGWYDYSYRDESLGIPLRFYQHKVGPAAAARLPEFAHLTADSADIPPGVSGISARWMDGKWIKWPYTDRQVTNILAGHFADHLAWAAQRADGIVAVTHHLPFSQLLKKSARLPWRFANAFMGSDVFGQAMLSQPKCRLAICGHSHWHDEITIDHLRCVNVGSTYLHKRYETFDL